MNVYAPCDCEEKVLFLRNLAMHDPGDDTPWMITGDFNLIHDPSNRNNANFSSMKLTSSMILSIPYASLNSRCGTVNTPGPMVRLLPPLSV
jgi:hypothetical protein